MAHSTAAATTGEVSYLLNGKIVKVLKKTEIKTEALSGLIRSGVFNAAGNNGTTAAATNIIDATGNGNMGAYNQLSTTTNASQQLQQTYVRLPINSNSNGQQVETATYTVSVPQQQSGTGNNGSAIKYEPNDDYNGVTGGGQQQGHSTVIKLEQERYSKYTSQHHHSNTKLKSKLSHLTGSNMHHHGSAAQRKRKPDKAGKGLRHFSMKVCEKVKEKGTTTYNEVADELVNEELKHNSFDTPNCDQKNIRRRVYDALNVLMAMEIIAKDKKEIRWIGLPSNSLEQRSALEKENEERRERVEQKHQQLRELILQQVSFKGLIDRNKEAERQGIIPTPNSSIQLPFIIVNTHKSTKINCSVTNDKSEYIFKFDDKFEMHDDAEVLKRMGLLFGLDKGQCTYDDIERAKTLVPPNFGKYIEAYGNGTMTGSGGGIDGDNTCDSDDEMQTYMELTNDSHEDDDLEHSDID